MTYTAITLILAAIICSALCWRVWPVERRRMVAAWVLIILAAGFQIAGLHSNNRWLTELAGAFQELAAIQFLAIFVNELMVRRWSVHMILSDLAVNLSYLAVVFRLLTRLGTDVNGLIATSTVVTAIIGLSMQDILMNSVGGVVMQLEREIAAGDFIRTDHGSGWVRKVRTRYTAVETTDSDLVLIPNQFMTKGAVKIVSKSHRTILPFHLPYDHLPTRVIEEVEGALRGSAIDGVASLPEPRCVIGHLHPGHIEYHVLAYLVSPGHDIKQHSEILTRVYFALTRAEMPFTGISYRVEMESQPTSVRPQSTDFSIANLKNNDVFRSLTADEMEFLAHRLKRIRFAPGETVVTQGDEGDSLYIVVKGKLRVMLSANHDRSDQVAILQPGSIFGEMSLLTGDLRSASVIAMEQVDCDRLDKVDFAEVLIRRPDLVASICLVMDQRQSSLSQAREKMNATPLFQNSRQNLLARIQSFFNLAETR